MGHPLAPWKMWGSTQLLTIDRTNFSTREQAVKLNYRRPDSFQFFFHCQIIQGPNVVPIGGILSVTFDVILGVGRSAVNTAQSDTTLDSFAIFNWTLTGGAGTPMNPKWTTATQTQQMRDNDATSRMVCDSFVGEDINGSVRAETSIVTEVWKVAATAYVAPRTHIRPDWFGDGPNGKRFIGGELGGT
jgi:hypothetical protein